MNVEERIEALEAEFNERRKSLKAKMQREEEFQQNDDKYWFIDDEGSVGSTVYDNRHIDRYRQTIGNFFQTKADAEFAVEKLIVEAEMRKFSEPLDLEKNQYTFSFNWDDERFNIDCVDYTQYTNCYYFDSVDEVYQAIESVGEDRIKKYIFGLED